jgi:hypothetical protein
VGARSLLQLQKKKIQSSIWRVRDHYYDRKKNKDTVICLAGARLLLRPEKKKIQLSVWWVRDHYTTGKKKRYSRLSGGCAIVITTKNKIRYSRLSGGCAIIITTGKKKDTVVCLAGAQSLLRPKIK